MSAKCEEEGIDLSGDDLARMRDCSSYQRHLSTRLKTLTTHAMIKTIFSSFNPSKGRLHKRQYSEFVQLVAKYEPLTDSKWVEECTFLGADSRQGLDLEDFSRLYTEIEGAAAFRSIKEDYAKLFV